MELLSNTEEISREKVLRYKNSQLGEGEPNYYEALTSFNFLSKILFVAALLIISVIICLTTTLDTSIDSWYYNLYKPDWAPDGITIVIIYSFLSILFVWAWYAVSKAVKNAVVDFFFVAFYVMYTLWFIFLFHYHNIAVSRILMNVITGFAGALFLFAYFYCRIGSAGLFLFMFLGWSILFIVYCYKIQDLTKEYKILGMVTNKNSTLYKKKIRMEIVDGIKVNEFGEKIEFNPDEQE